jgi:hypothetical protein
LIIAMLAAGARSPSLAAKGLKPQLCSSPLPGVLAQDDETDENEVPNDQIEKYVSVYKAMQRDHSITIDQAAAAQGLTIGQFRQLENRVERDDAALEQARDELQAAARGSPASNPSR